MSHRIRRVSVHRVQVPLSEGVYAMSGDRSLDAFDSTIVCLETESGLEGWGEVVPLGPAYLPSYAEGARTGLRELAPALIGADPTEVERINSLMDASLRGHPYVKSALDIACWDILGKVAGLPVCILLGGRFGGDLDIYRSITHSSPEQMTEWVRTFKAQGHRHFQLKVGGVPDTDIARIRAAAAVLDPGDIMVADANCGWTRAGAARVVRAVSDLDLYIEQPCPTYEDCLSIRRRYDGPFVLDESIDGLAALQRALADGAMDCINIKISKLGGLTRARVVRDVCIQSGIMVTIEDTACTDIAAAAVSHLAQSTPERMRLFVTLANLKIAFRTAHGSPQTAGGRACAPNAPGLGIEPIRDVMGPPIFQCS